MDYILLSPGKIYKFLLDIPAYLLNTFEGKLVKNEKQQKAYIWEIVWRNVIFFVFLHLTLIYGVYLLIGWSQWKTIAWTYFVGMCGGQGITSGAHRLWAHRTYKAKLPLRILLGIFQTIAMQNSIYVWVRDHRVHHKFTETDADPHNAARGFFFSHMGWLLIKKHKDVRIKGSKVDVSDLEKDGVVVFQMKYYYPLIFIFGVVVPTWVPMYFWGEEFSTALFVVVALRYTLSLHGTWLVNSMAHIWGAKPYDKNIAPTENAIVAHIAFGEGWHNYHHVFPYDYKAAELGNYELNWSTAFIDFMAKIGWAYALKTVSLDIINKRKARTGGMKT